MHVVDILESAWGSVSHHVRAPFIVARTTMHRLDARRSPQEKVLFARTLAENVEIYIDARSHVTYFYRG